MERHPEQGIHPPDILCLLLNQTWAKHEGRMERDGGQPGVVLLDPVAVRLVGQDLGRLVFEDVADKAIREWLAKINGDDRPGII